MIKIMSFLIPYFLWVLCPLKAEENPLGYISNSTINIGDDIQSIAAKRFLKGNAVAIDREFVSEFDFNKKIKAVISGWFMHDKNGYWDLARPPPAVSWPPSPVIDPFFISIHFTVTFLSTVFSEDNIEYLKKYAPIGARDLFTLNELQKREIPSYFSGCLTLTLENPYQERNDIIYLVDLDEQCVNYIKSTVKSPIVVLTHGKSLLQFLNNEQRLKYAEYLLNLYRKAKCVVTPRLHAAMPCLAFETPVLLLASGVDSRFVGLIDHLWCGSKEELLHGEIDYDFDHPPVNPTTYLPLRENLIKIMTQWVDKHS
jgi:hypothetical protein